MMLTLLTRGVRSGALRAPRLASTNILQHHAIAPSFTFQTPMANANRNFSTKRDEKPTDSEEQSSEEKPAPKKGMRARMMSSMDSARQWLHGPLGEANDSTRMNTKVVATGRQLVPESEAPELPEMELTSLSQVPIKIPSPAAITILTIGFNQLSMKQLRDWRDTAQQASTVGGTSRLVRGPGSPLTIRIVELSVVESWLFSKFKEGILKSYKKSMESHLHSSCTVRFGKFTEHKKVLNIENHAVGHVFMIDTLGRVRWHACGKVLEEDKILFDFCLGELVTEEKNR